MEVSYLGLHIDSLTYVMLLLFFLVVFLVIWIFSEIKRQKRYNRKKLEKVKRAAEALTRSGF
jgi:preprotein translocase subunit YajC